MKTYLIKKDNSLKNVNFIISNVIIEKNKLHISFSFNNTWKLAYLSINNNWDFKKYKLEVYNWLKEKLINEIKYSNT